MKKRSNKPYWLIFIAIALGLHLILLLFFKPSFFSIFGKKVEQSSPVTGDNQVFHPNAIITLHVDVDDDTNNTTQTKQIEENEEPDIPDDSSDEYSTESTESGPAHSSQLDDIIGIVEGTLPPGNSTDPVRIPPKPLEIAWPDTRKLNHCLGRSIDVRIEVDPEGAILDIKTERTGIPEDCITAAMEAAKKIIFLPGTINGKPSRMWAYIRIDFRKKE